MSLNVLDFLPHLLPLLIRLLYSYLPLLPLEFQLLPPVMPLHLNPVHLAVNPLCYLIELLDHVEGELDLGVDELALSLHGPELVLDLDAPVVDGVHRHVDQAQLEKGLVEFLLLTAFDQGLKLRLDLGHTGSRSGFTVSRGKFRDFFYVSYLDGIVF